MYWPRLSRAFKAMPLYEQRSMATVMARNNRFVPPHAELLSITDGYTYSCGRLRTWLHHFRVAQSGSSIANEDSAIKIAKTKNDISYAVRTAYERGYTRDNTASHPPRSVSHAAPGAGAASMRHHRFPEQSLDASEPGSVVLNHNPYRRRQ